MNLKELTIKEFHEGLADKKFSAVEATTAFLNEIENRNKKINAYLSLARDLALNEAEKVDSEISAGRNIGILDGVPFAIKDNILIEGVKATAASKILENYVATYDATVIKKLKANHAVFLGKTNLDEFAMGSSTENSAFGPSRNPYDLERVTGGSSGGSAAAVASNMALAALGSDTGGSIRQPAGFCGVVGLKPTYGAVSRYGLIAMASSLDQIGPIAKTVEDAEIVFNAIKGEDPFDSTSVNLDRFEKRTKELKDLVIGLPKEYFVSGIHKDVEKKFEEAVRVFKEIGIKFKEVSLPHTKYAIACYYIIVPAEISANLARFEGIRYSRIPNVSDKNLKDIYFKDRGLGLGPEPKRRILLGTYVLSAGYYDAYYSKAQKVRTLIKQDFVKVFDSGVDVFMTPVSPTAAFKIGEKTSDPLSMYLEDIFTLPVNLAGLPGISIPIRPINNLPIGFQLIGQPFCENEILRLGKAYEKNF